LGDICKAVGSALCPILPTGERDLGRKGQLFLKTSSMISAPVVITGRNSRR
jgi:hypothetical protein